MFKTIYKHLVANDFDCYSIGQHEGDCKKEYIVIKNKTPRALSNVLLEEEAELLLYYPLGNYSKVEDFINGVKEAMQELPYDYNYTPYPIIIEDDKKAYMTILSYTNTRKKVL
ncbi:Uncharacterised protein [uncultured Clostridium sp.]|nr:Uncharacterised protein [uncultured Clostridium sp.]SCI95381.1 Uncharacterised protein [uncultured Clostridium sp.]